MKIVVIVVIVVIGGSGLIGSSALARNLDAVGKIRPVMRARAR